MTLESKESLAILLPNFVCSQIDFSARYMNLFLSISKLDPEDCLLVYGGSLLSYDIETLKDFQAIYIDSMYAIDQKLDVLASYIESGGGLILDLGLNPTETWNNLPFPIQATAIKSYGPLELNQTNFSNKIASNIDTRNVIETTQAVEVDMPKSDSLATINNVTVMSSSDIGEGKIIISGLGLPRIAVNEQGQAESKILLNTINYVIKGTYQPNLNFPTFSLQTSEVTVNIENTQINDAVWLKISNYPGWIASCNGKQLKIFEAGPGFMLVFPQIQGNATIHFTFTATGYVVLGEILSILGVLYIVIRVLMSTQTFSKKVQNIQNRIKRMKNTPSKQPELGTEN